MLEQTLNLTGCFNIQFFNSLFVTYGTPCPARDHYSRQVL